MQRRLLLASVVSVMVLMGWVYMNRPPPGQPGEVEPAPVEQAEPTATEEPAPPPTLSPATPPSDDPSAETKVAGSEEEVVIETETYTVTFSNRGGVVTSWILNDYDASTGGPLDLVHADGAKEFGYPFSLELPDGKPLEELNKALFVVDQGPSRRRGSATVSFEYAQGGSVARKTFRFEREGYLFELDSELMKNGQPVSHLVTWNGGFGDTAQLQDSLNSSTFYFDTDTGELERRSAVGGSFFSGCSNGGDSADSRLANSGPYPYVGIDDRFFAAAFLPLDEGQTLRIESGKVEIEPAEGAAKEAFPTIAAGVSEVNRFRVFVGPKSFDLLSGVSRELRQMVDFGFFGFVAEPIFWGLRWTHDNIVSNYGWAIVLLTVFINFALFPLKWKSMKSMKRMQALQPLLKQINDKYKGLSMRDPKKQQQQEETMALYKKHGVNPMGSCLPTLMLFPFFIGFYNVLTVAIEVRGAAWLWVDDLSSPEALSIRVLPLAMVASQFWMQSMTPTPAADPTQMRLMKFMPLMFGFIFYGFSSGLVLFWLTGNVVGVVQQQLLNRFSSEEVVIEKPKIRRKKKSKGRG